MNGSSLYQEFSKMLGAPDSKILPRILQKIADEREIRVLMAAFPPATVSELAGKTDIAGEVIQVMVEDLFQKGLIFFSKKEGEPRYYRVKTVPVPRQFGPLEGRHSGISSSLEGIHGQRMAGLRQGHRSVSVQAGDPGHPRGGHD